MSQIDATHFQARYMTLTRANAPASARHPDEFLRDPLNRCWHRRPELTAIGTANWDDLTGRTRVLKHDGDDRNQNTSDGATTGCLSRAALAQHEDHRVWNSLV